jgi:hypothetical protein
MFELSKAIVDDIIFAMEDQEGAWQIEVETGRLIAREVACGDGDQVPMPRPETVAVPDWSPREGFKLMETFAAQVRQSTARHALHDALAHGRGVFKAFKEVLVAHPEVEKAFRERKASVMGRVIRAWYDDLRVAKGLERLGEEPEDHAGLIEGDLGVSTGLASVARPFMLSLLDGLAEELAADLPSVVVAREVRVLKKEFEGEDWVGVWVEDGEGGAVAGAAGILEQEGAQPIGRVFFVALRPEFRGMADALVERVAEELGEPAGSLLLLETPLAPPELGKGLFSSGFSAYGLRSWRRA